MAIGAYLKIGKLSLCIMGRGAVPGKRFHMVSRIVLWDTWENSLWSPNMILKEEFWTFFGNFCPLQIGPSKILAITNQAYFRPLQNAYPKSSPIPADTAPLSPK